MNISGTSFKTKGRKVPIKRPGPLAIILNTLVSLFWTIVCVSPLVYVIFLYVRLEVLYWGVPIYLLPTIVPRSWLDRFRLFGSEKEYNSFGLKRFRKLIQDGDYINQLIRKFDPEYQLLHRSKNIPALLAKTNVNERFHWSLLLVYMHVVLFTALSEHYFWSFVIFVLNIAYNVYPILLMQYYRLRFENILNPRTKQQNSPIY